MSQHDYDITTADANTGITMRAEINAALQALAGNNSGATEPAIKYPYMWWADTTSGYLKQRNAANTAWITVMLLATALMSDSDKCDGFHASQTPAANQIPVLNSAGRLVLDGADDGSSKIQTGGVIKAGGLNIKGTAATDQPTYSAEFLDASNWTSTGWAGSFATGWSHTTGNTNTLVHDHAAVSNTKYQIAYTVTGRTAGTFTISFGGQTSAGISATGAWGPTTTSTDSMSITPTSDFNGTIIISIKSITGVSTPLIVGTNSSGGIAFEARALNASSNVFFGKDAGSYNTTGSSNVANGYMALRYNTTGSSNIANGYMALYSNTTGSSNAANGYAALYSNTTGSYNVANGQAAGQFISGGSVTNTTPNNSVYLGALTKASADGNTNEIVIGYNTTGMGSNTAILGNSNITRTYLRGQVLIGTTTSDGVNNLQVNGTIASKGIKLDGTASSNVNTLDYYQEGTFTPVIYGKTTAGTGTYTIQLGKYTRLGNVVFYNVEVYWTEHTGTGLMRISGLPYNSAVTSAAACYYDNFTVESGKEFVALIMADTSEFYLLAANPAGGSIVTIPMDTSGVIRLTGHYFV